mgnify:CR=1 FL=1
MAEPHPVLFNKVCCTEFCFNPTEKLYLRMSLYWQSYFCVKIQRI